MTHQPHTAWTKTENISDIITDEKILEEAMYDRAAKMETK
jgi:hypothetical protein